MCAIRFVWMESHTRTTKGTVSQEASVPMVGHQTIRYYIMYHSTLHSDHCDVCTLDEVISQEALVQMVGHQTIRYYIM